jgi:hypothetical protein
MTDFGRRAIPPDHASRHEDGGADEVDAALLDNRINFVDRGDPENPDFVVGDLSTNGLWYDLDLSSIVPVNTVAVLLVFVITDDAAGKYLQIRKSGSTYARSSAMFRTQVANVSFPGGSIVFVDSNRKVNYRTSNTTFTSIDITVQGWFV